MLTFAGRTIPNTENMGVEDITMSMAAEFCESFLPDIWREINVKFIEAPGNYHGFKAVAVTFTSAIAEMAIQRKNISAANNIGAIAGVLAEHNYPTYYVSKSLLESLKRTHPPTGMTWEGLKLPHPGAVFMLPIGALKDIATNSDIVMIGYARFLASTPIKVPGVKMSINPWDKERISVFYSIGNGMTTQDCTFPLTQSLEPDPEWIDRATEQYRKETGDDTSVSGEFTSYITGIIANLILVMQARPEIVEHGGGMGKRLKSGLLIHRPNFIGRKYVVVRKQRTVGERHFTELDWRCGHFKQQHYGAGGKDTKIIWIDPYIAYVRGAASGKRVS